MEYVRSAYGCLIAAVVVLGLSAGPSAAAEPQASIQVSADAEVEVPPDLAVLDFGVFTEAQTAAAAARDNSERMERVLSSVRSKLGAKARLQTGTYTLQPNYSAPRDGTVPRVVGYRASNVIQLKTGEFARVGEIIDLAIQAGANQVQRVAFMLSDETAPHNEALRSATLKARAEADVIAAALGVKSGTVQSVVEQETGEARPLMRQAMLARGDAAAVTPLEAGVVRVRARVVLTVLIER